MTEKDHFAFSRPCNQLRHPVCLIARQVVFRIRSVKTNQQPILVLQCEIARLLAKAGRVLSKYAFPPVYISWLPFRARLSAPSTLGQSFRKRSCISSVPRVVDITEMHDELKSSLILGDAVSADGRTI